MAPVLLLLSYESIGAVAQMGERMTGSHEVRGSIPLGSTNPIKHLQQQAFAAFSSNWIFVR